jgi:hypothetical protein
MPELTVDNSVNNQPYQNLVQIERAEAVLMTDHLPAYFRERLPGISKLIEEIQS